MALTLRCDALEAQNALLRTEVLQLYPLAGAPTSIGLVFTWVWAAARCIIRSRRQRPCMRVFIIDTTVALLHGS